MRTPSLLAAAVLSSFALSAAALAPAAPARPTTSPLRGHDCLEPAFARSYVDLDHRSLLVDAGRNRYLIEVTPSCWNLDTTSVIGFRGDPISNRVCGAAMDAVLVRNSIPCRIEHMRLLSREEYLQALHEREEWKRQRKAERAAAKRKR
jgi:hypothetical protein